MRSHCAPAPDQERAMCKKCDDIDRKIAHYQYTLVEATDALAIELLSLVIEDFEADKKALHPEPK
jgi:hypothetical protein